MRQDTGGNNDADMGALAEYGPDDCKPTATTGGAHDQDGRSRHEHRIRGEEGWRGIHRNRADRHFLAPVLYWARQAGIRGREVEERQDEV